jgi:hypothetical protein
MLVPAAPAVDQRQDLLEHLPRYRELGHLEGNVTAVADDLGADLDQLLAQAGQRPRAVLGEARKCRFLALTPV